VDELEENRPNISRVISSGRDWACMGEILLEVMAWAIAGAFQLSRFIFAYSPFAFYP